MFKRGGVGTGLPHLVILAAFLAVCSSVFAQSPQFLSPPPGTYRDTIIVSPGQAGLELIAGFGNDNWGVFDFSEPIVLDSYPGEARTYRLRLEGFVNGEIRELGTFEYTVDKRVPVLPALSPAPGRYFAPLDLDLRAFGGQGITVHVNGIQVPAGQTNYRLWGRPGQASTYLVEVRHDDGSPFRAQPLSAEYIIDLRQQARQEASLEILSPVEGRFRNPQLLYINNSGLGAIRYTLDGSDPAENGIPYLEPVELSGDNLRLRVSGVAADGSLLSREVSFSAGTEVYPGVRQGYLGTQVDLEPVGQGYTYVTTERSPGNFDPDFGRALRIRPQAGTLRTFVLRFRNQQSQEAEYRMFFLLEGRTPAQPDVTIVRRDATGNLRYLRNPELLFPEDAILPSGSTEFRLEFAVSQAAGQAASSRNASITVPTKVAEVLASLGISSLPQGGTALAAFHSGAQGLRSEALILQVRNPRPLEGSPRLVALSSSASIAAQSGSVYFGIGDVPLVRVNAGTGWAFSIPRAYRTQEPLSFWTVLEDGRAGNRIESTTVVLENLPPAGPRIVVDGRSVSIQSSERVFYRVLSPRIDSPGVVAEYRPYAGPIDLLPIPGANTSYRVEAYSIDAGEVRSTVSRTPMVYLNEVAAPEPDIIGITRDQVTGLQRLNLSISNYEQGFRYRYRLDAAGRTLAQGVFEGGQAVIELPEVESAAVLSISVESLDTANAMAPANYETGFRIDRIAPQAPVVAGQESGSYGRAVTVTVTNPAPEDSLLFYSVNSEERRLYSGPLVFDAAPDTVASYRLVVFTQDNAGNTSRIVERSYVIDREAPPVPAYVLLDASGEQVSLGSARNAINRDIELRFNSAYPVRYEVSTTDASPAIPTVFSAEYLGPIRLSAPAGQERVYKFLYRAVDEVGNLSAVPRLLEVRIDKTVPETPQEPVVIREGNAGLLEWTPGNDTIYYKFESQSEFRTYTASVPWQIPPGSDGISIIYYLRDDAGNRSPEARITIPRRNQTTRPSVQVSPTAQVYSSVPEIRVQATRPNAIIRYELAINGQPRDVSDASQEWGRAELAEPVEGETLRYSIAMRQFEPGFEASELVRLDFVVDRTPPQPPSGSLPQAVLVSEGTSLELQTGDGIVFFTVETIDLGTQSVPDFSGLPESQDVDDSSVYRRADGPIQLSGEPGRAVRYLVRAIARDEAGNFSNKARIWEVVVDRASVFVNAGNAASAASAAAAPDGSRERPYILLQDAIAAARSSGRSNIFLAQGSYTIDASLRLAGGRISLNGGFDSSWTQVSAETILVPSNSFSGNSLFSVSGAGVVEVSGLYVTDPAQRLEVLADLQGGTLQVRQGATLASIGRVAAVRASSQARVELEGARISAYDPATAELIKLQSGARLSLVDSFIEYDSAPSFLGTTAVLQQHSAISGTDSFVSIEASTIETYRVREGTTIQVTNSELRLNGSTIFAPTSSELGIAIHGVASTINLLGTRLSSGSATGVAVLVRVDSSSLNVQGGEMISASKGSASLVVGSGPGTRVSVSGTQISETAVAELLTIFQMREAALSVRELRIRGPLSSREVIFASLDSSDAVVLDSEINLSSDGRVIGFYVPRQGSLEVRNNSISGGRNSVAIYAGAPSTPMNISNNGFANWTSLLVRSSRSASPLAPDAVFRDVASLEAISADDQIFSGNRIDRGF